MFDDDAVRVDAALICLNGHVINPHYRSRPQFNQDFCDRCGKPAIAACPDCQSPIPGFPVNLSATIEQAPAFCAGCGKPYPWHLGKLRAAHAMADELEGLDDAQRALLKASIDDIAGETPMSEVAVTRVKKMIRDLPTTVGERIRQLVVDIASETAVKFLKGGGL
jgi:hypothetical protein